MTSVNSLLEEALDAWKDARMGVIDEVRNIPSKQFDFRPAPDVKSVQELVVHILEVAMMMTGELTATETNFYHASFRNLLKKHASQAYAARTKRELITLLRSQLRTGERRFRAAGELHMLQQIRRFDGQWGTRLAWLYHGIAQEMYHRGQLTLYERLLGITPSLTRRIEDS